MWNKRSEPGGGQAVAPPSSFSSARPMSPDATFIGETIYIKGDIRTEQELYVAGQLDGSVESLSGLTVGPNAKLKANIKAKEVTIHGSVHGSVEVSGKITIHQEGSLIGDIKTTGIVIDDGAYFKGSIDIIRPGRGEPAPVEGGTRR